MASEEILKNRAIKKAKRRNVGFEVSVFLQLSVLNSNLIFELQSIQPMEAVRSINAL